MKPCNVLFVTWDGPQVSYLEGLFLPIFVGLRREGYAFHVLQFTWDEARDKSGPVSNPLDASLNACREAGVAYERVTINRGLGGLSPYLSARKGGQTVDNLVAKWSIDTLMPRSIMGAIAVSHARAGKNLPIVFDADGLAADERADFDGLSRSSLTYRMLKAYERAMIRRARSVIGRTEAACDMYRAADHQPAANKYVVSVNGRDPKHFCGGSPDERRATRAQLQLPPDSPIIVHSGSFGEKYCPDDELAVISTIRLQHPDTSFLVLTGSPEAALQFFANRFNKLPEWITVRRLPFNEMGAALAACYAGFCLVRDAVSTQAVQATKLGEFLLSGLSVIATPNTFLKPLVGQPFAFCYKPGSNAEAQVADWFCGRVLRDNTLAGKARSFALDHLTVDSSVRAYRTALEQATSK